MFTMARRPSTWQTCVVAATFTVSAHQHVVTLLSDRQGHALLTARLLLQVRLCRTHFRFTSGTLICTILSVVNWKLTCRLHCINCIVVRRCWAPVEWRRSKLSWWWWWWWWWWQKRVFSPMRRFIRADSISTNVYTSTSWAEWYLWIAIQIGSGILGGWNAKFGRSQFHWLWHWLLTLRIALPRKRVICGSGEWRTHQTRV